MSARKRATKKRSNRKGLGRKTKKSETFEVASNAQAFGRLREWFLPNGGIFSCLNLHGNTKWLPGCIPHFAIGLVFAIGWFRGIGPFSFTLEKCARFGHG